MEIKQLRSDAVYQKILAVPATKKDDIYRYELMQPFEGKWACYHIPLKATQKNGDGGIPGYIFGSLIPNDDTMARMPAALAHECNHNVRFQFEKWKNDCSLGEMMVNEGWLKTLPSFFMEKKWLARGSLKQMPPHYSR